MQQRRAVTPDAIAHGETGALSGRVLDYLQTHHADTWSLLTEGRLPAGEDHDLQDLNDLVYCLHLLGWPVLPCPSAGSAIPSYLQSFRLAGDLNGRNGGKPVSVHGTAYTLGALTLLKSREHDLLDEILTPASWRWNDLFDPKSLLPRWPAKWSHHNWRVSHWVGGSLSILRELSRHRPDACEASGAPTIEKALDAADRLIDERTGVLKCYRSRLLQMVFRQAYRLRHDPVLGDVGGVVHVHWVNYAEDRPFKAGFRLFDTARRAMCERRPFMEDVPYCLDFDVVQIVRAAMPSDLAPAERHALKVRAAAYAEDIAGYLDAKLGPAYALHKLPGALATLHECALIDPSTSLAALGLDVDGDRPIDVMKDTSWL